MSCKQIIACADDEEMVQFPIHLLGPNTFQQEFEANSTNYVNADSVCSNYYHNHPEYKEIAKFPNFSPSLNNEEELLTGDSSTECTEYISSRQAQYIEPLIIGPSAQQRIYSPMLFNYLYRFFYSNSNIVETPSSLYNIPINKSRLRSNGINIISIDYSTSIPNPEHVLQENEQLIIFGPKYETENYFERIGESTNLIPATSSLSPARFDQFAEKLMNHHIAIVPVPKCLIGSTLVETPQFARFGITVISINLQMQHPAKMSNKVFEPNDMLLCCFSKSKHKHQTLMNAFSNLSNFSPFT